MVDDHVKCCIFEFGIVKIVYSEERLNDSSGLTHKQRALDLYLYST